MGWGKCVIKMRDDYLLLSTLTSKGHYSAQVNSPPYAQLNYPPQEKECNLIENKISIVIER